MSTLTGAAKWTWFHGYVILDVFSRYVVGWTVQYRENAQLAKVTLLELNGSEYHRKTVNPIRSRRRIPSA